jgi:hypothetical protein
MTRSSRPRILAIIPINAKRLSVLVIAITSTLLPIVVSAYDLCNQADRDEVVALTAGSLVDAVDQALVAPGSVLTVQGQGFEALGRLRSTLNLHIRFLSLEAPSPGAPDRWQAYDATSFSLLDDTTLIVDVPPGIHGSNGSISIESNLPTRCEDAGGRVWVAHQFGFGWMRINYAAPDPPVGRITNLSARLLPTDEVQLDWTDVPHERGYTVVWRKIGDTQWNGIDWLGGNPFLPANATTVTFPMAGRLRLDPPEAYEFSVQSWNYLSSARSNVAGLDGRFGEVEILNSPSPLVSTLCDGTVPASQMSAFFDQDGDGLVAGFERHEDLPFPFFPVADPSYSHGYWNFPGRYFAQNNQGLTANLIVVAQYFSCGPYQPQFVAAHMHVQVNNNGQLVVEPILLLAGDELNEIQLPGGDPLRGVVMSGTFDGSLDAAALLNEDRVSGVVVGNVTFGSPGGIAYGSWVEFDFDVVMRSR